MKASNFRYGHIRFEAPRFAAVCSHHARTGRPPSPFPSFSDSRRRAASHPKLAVELTMFQFKTTDAETVTLHHIAGQGDDFADSLRYAVWPSGRGRSRTPASWPSGCPSPSHQQRPGLSCDPSRESGRPARRAASRLSRAIRTSARRRLATPDALRRNRAGRSSAVPPRFGCGVYMPYGAWSPYGRDGPIRPNDEASRDALQQ